MTDNQLVFYIISREEIASGDTSRFLLEFGMPADQSRRPRYPMGSVMFSVSGYDHSPDELYSIPEVRAYFRKVHRQWPCWLYYSELFSDALRIIAFCVIDSIEARRVAGEPLASVSFSVTAIVRFLNDGLEPLSMLTLAAGLGDQAYLDRFQAVMDYFIDPT